MKVQSLVSIGKDNLGRACTRALGLSLCLALLLVISGASAIAQVDPASNAASAAPAKANASEMATPATTPGEKAPATTTRTDQDGEGARVDRLISLRAQIEGAKTEPERARLRRTLVDYLVALNRQGEAINELRSMSREDKLDPVAFYNIGNALARLGDRESAIEAYRKAIKQRHGNYARALNNVGVLLLGLGRWDEAQESLASAVRLENFRYAEASYNLGRLYSARGEADLAIREWSRALISEPDHADAAIALARAHAEDGNPERGLLILDTFIARRGPNPEMVEARREILAGEGKVPSLTSTAKTAAPTSTPAPDSSNSKKVNPGSDTGSSPVRTAKDGKENQASSSLRRLTVDQQTYDLLQRARSAREADRNEEAASLYRRVLLQNDGFFPPANLELSFVLASMKRYNEAVSALTTLVDREGERYPIAYYHLGRQYEALGRLDRAGQAFEKAIAAHGDSNPQFLLDLSRVREKEANLVAAADAMESYIRISRNQGRVPDWSTQRLADLRQKIAATSSQAVSPRK